MMNKMYLALLINVFFLLSLHARQSPPEITYSIDYPNDISNNRFFSDVYSDKITRPSLSITGFNSSDLKTGYGLEQLVYYLAYNKEYGTNQEILELLKKIDNEANATLFSITGSDKNKVDAVNANARYLESKVFMALLGYVLQKNGYNYSDLDAALTDKSYTVYLNGFKQQLLTPEGGYLISFELHNGSVLSSPADPIHTTASLGSVIRAFDLYLGLENAFKYYADKGLENVDYYYCDTREIDCQQDWPLLTKSQKTSVLNRILGQADEMYSLNRTGLTSLAGTAANIALGNFGTLLTITAIATLPGMSALLNETQLDETQPGNWSYKQYLATGLVGLGAQYGGGINYTESEMQTWFNAAFIKTFDIAGTDRKKYFGYQTSDGKAFWAEGQYYFRITLNDLIPYIHAIRANDFWVSDGSGDLEYNGVRRSDPFNSSWFLNSLDWLAETATPNGESAPLDDGNKSFINTSSLLRWNYQYGNKEIGEKYSQINNRLTGNRNYGTSSVGSVVEIAIPSGGVTPYSFIGENKDYGNKSDVILGENDKQASVVRRSIGGKTHYVLLNGEIGDAIGRGEGHEQPDQLQLLYYVDDVSYILDTGYDQGNAPNNSQFNDVKYHNTASYHGVDGGGEANPSPGWKGRHVIKHEFPRDAKIRMVVVHKSIRKNYIEKTGNITAIYGEKDLGYFTYKILRKPNYLESKARHERAVLFIEDPNLPYIVDFNSIWKFKEMNKNFQMNYYTSGNIGNSEGDWHTSVDNSGNTLYQYFDAVEFDTYTQNYGTFEIDTENNIHEINKENGFDAVHTRITNLDGDETGTSNDLNTVAIFSTNEFSNSTIRRLFPSSRTASNPDINDYQVWYFSPKNNVIDVIVKRGLNSTSESFVEDIVFSINDSEFIGPNIILDGGKGYGFARFNNYNGLLKLDSDYAINITQPGYFYTSTRNVGTYSFPTESNIYIADWVTVTFTGNVNLTDANIYLGKSAKIATSSSGHISCTGSNFNRLNQDQQPYGVRLNSTYNTFTGCQFNGSYYGIASVYGHQTITNSIFNGNRYGVFFNQSSNNTINGGEFKGNMYGLYLNYNAEATVDGGEFTNNTSSGIRVYNSDLYIKNTTGILEDRTLIQNNGSVGIDLDNHANIWVQDANINNNGSYGITLDNTSRAYIGGSSINGNNSFHKQTGMYINSLAMTGSGESTSNWIVQARYNYWDGIEPVENVDYSGTVDTYGFLTVDPADPEPTHPPRKVAGSTMNSSPSRVITQSDANDIASNEKGAFERQKSLSVKQELMRLKTWMNDKPEDPENSRWLKNWVTLMHYAGNDLSNKYRNEFHGKNNKWLARFHKLNQLTADSLQQMEDSVSFSAFDRTLNNFDSEELKSPAQKMRLVEIVGEAAVLMEMDIALEQEKYHRVISLYEKYGSYIRNIDNQYALLSSLSLAYQGIGEYGAALAALEEVELLEPDAERADVFVASDLSDIKQILQDSVNARSQKVVFAKQVSGLRLEEESIPETFTLKHTYPNPFNPSTIVSFDVPVNGKVRVDVYDISGKLVSVLTNTVYQAGSHALTFDAGNLASGIYIVRAQYGSEIQIQKITLIK